MSGFFDVAVIVAVCAIVLVRQTRPRKVAADARRWWLLPAVLVVLAVRQPGLIDAGHRAASVGLLAGGVLAGLATGAAWAWTTRIWSDESGALWARGGKATAAIWLGGAVLRVALYGLGALVGVHQGGAATMMTVAAVLLARSGVLAHRAQGLRPAYGVPAGG
ncbi:DUF1453 domain-containing protein [Streptomyces sp. NPDC051162]|uniref:DUF1453 domain-containing protein n=1 Tax=unclassified Streptomyces TaxID=2593676 RepID=UPI00341D2BE2